MKFQVKVILWCSAIFILVVFGGTYLMCKFLGDKPKIAVSNVHQDSVMNAGFVWLNRQDSLRYERLSCKIDTSKTKSDSILKTHDEWLTVFGMDYPGINNDVRTLMIEKKKGN
jgi:hypothetical protein